MRRIGIITVLALTALGACSKDSPPEEPPVSSAAPFRPCGAIGAGALAASAVSPDGTVLAAATLSGQLVLYRYSDGTRLNTLWDLPGQQVGVFFSKDGRLLVAANRMETRVWSFPDLTPVRTFKHPHTGQTTALAISPDGAVLATGGVDSENSQIALVRIWSMTDGSLQGTWRRLYEARVESLAFAPDGNTLAVALGHFVALIHVPDASEQRILSLGGQQASWSADGRLLAAGGVVMNVDTSKVVKPMETSLRLETTTFSSDGSLYAEGAEAGVTVYRTADWTKLHVFPVREGRPSRLAFSQDNTELRVDMGASRFSCNGASPQCPNGGNEILIHSLQTPATTRTFSLGPSMTGEVTFSPDGSLLATTADNVLSIWKTSDLSAVVAPPVRNPWNIQFSPDQGRILVDSTIHDLATGQELQRLNGGVLSPDFRMSARIELGENKVLLHDVATGKLLKEFATTQWTFVSGFSPDGRFLTVTGLSGGVDLRVLDVARGKVRHSFDLELKEGGPFVRFSPNGRWLASTGQSDFPSVMVLGLEDERRTALENGFTAAFSPDSTVLAAGNAKAEVLLWRTSDFLVRERLSGHGTSAHDEQYPQAVISVAFARTGQLATLGADRTVRLWCSQ
ncbi:WD domain-/G-beta repeat-containing protein [Myxococcus stipitatus DSM 14675]|uniref:WD domain-/G-beta repeat-containing protein n=1 Tax=Myxococcus stipitatus (strain DSM 14675 / JCM 12634 / Mx s8) TaxID=1278073 RepID=L7UGG2_MYXSD|nr:WD40 repeat domain-containing protein [Myxococcus stipitatus]AGC47128.1 WD domain-/G-beta repeat-containing protein [Myxococcus stipitatus DSM 14675]